MNTHLLATKQICEMIGVTRPTLDAMVAQGRFPKPMRITARRLGYKSDDVEAWMQSGGKLISADALANA